MLIGPHKIFVIAALVLLAAAGKAETLPGIEPGPLGVEVADDIVIRDPLQERDVIFRVMHPVAAGPFPVIVFSAGGFCASQTYDPLVNHWVSHGYAVIAPHHMDSPSNADPVGRDNTDLLLPSRLRDMSFALDSLDELGKLAGISDRLDKTRVAVAGHSFGAGIASMKTGVRIKTEYQGPWGDPYDDRFQAAILLSAPGDGVELVDDAYAELRLPLMATGGTADVGRGYDPSLSPGDFRRLTYERAPPGDKYSVILDGADHFLGGLFCNRGQDEDPDAAAGEIIGAMTTVFLDAYLKEDPAAMQFLLTADVAALTQGRADYRHR